MLKNLKISYKMGTGFALVLVLTAVLGSVSIYQMINIKTNVKQFENKVTPLSESSNKIKETFLWTCYEIRGYSRTGDKDYWDRAQSYLKDVRSWIGKLESTASKNSLSNVLQDAKNMRQLIENYDKKLIEIQNEFAEIRSF